MSTQPSLQNLNAPQFVGGSAKKSNSKMIMWIVIGAIVIGLLLGFAFPGDGFWYGVGGTKGCMDPAYTEYDADATKDTPSMCVNFKDDGGGGGDDDCGANQEKNDDGDCVCVTGFSFESDDNTTCVADVDGIPLYTGSSVNINKDLIKILETDYIDNRDIIDNATKALIIDNDNPENQVTMDITRINPTPTQDARIIKFGIKISENPTYTVTFPAATSTVTFI